MSLPPQKRRIGRPSLGQQEQMETRRQIIETAKALFSEQGIESVSMRKIAAKAGFSQRLPYLYFENKQSILRYIWEDFFVALFSECHSAIAGVKGSVKRLDVFLRAYVCYWFAHPDQYELVFLGKDQIGGTGDQYYVEEFGVVGRYDVLADLVKACIDDGEFKLGDAELYGQVLISSLHGILHGLIVVSEYPWKPKNELVDMTLDVIFRGMKAE